MGALLVKPSPRGGNFVKSVYHSCLSVYNILKYCNYYCVQLPCPGVFARGLSNKIAPGESPLHLIYIIDKAPLVPGGG